MGDTNESGILHNTHEKPSSPKPQLRGSFHPELSVLLMGNTARLHSSPYLTFFFRGGTGTPALTYVQHTHAYTCVRTHTYIHDLQSEKDPLKYIFFGLSVNKIPLQWMALFVSRKEMQVRGTKRRFRCKHFTFGSLHINYQCRGKMSKDAPVKWPSR